jgi:hypothetical protein
MPDKGFLFASRVFVANYSQLIITIQPFGLYLIEEAASPALPCNKFDALILLSDMTACDKACT